jgi:hypothetical protein
MNMAEPWECPRCHKINSPALMQCFCDQIKIQTSKQETHQFDINRDIFHQPEQTREKCKICNGYHLPNTGCVYLQKALDSLSKK